MTRARATLAAEIRRDLAAARGAARSALAAAESHRARAARDRVEAVEAYRRRIARLGAEREAARLAIGERFRRESAALADRLAEIAAAGTPGAAGAAWHTWRPTDPERGRRPGLLRIGTLGHEPPLPALVPLLDRAHVRLTGPDRSTVDGVIAGLLLRVLGGTRPGEVRLTVYDPERLGGCLAAFAPLGHAGLLTFVGPGGLGGTLDELVEHIRRINESVLAGEHASLAELTAATAGPRPEPWRLVVLLGDEAGAAELTSAQRAQLDRVVRTGVACGVHVIARGMPIEGQPDVETVPVPGTGPLAIRIDPPPPPDRVAAFCRELAERVLAGPPPTELADLLPAKPWRESSAAGLAAPLGDGSDGARCIACQK